MYTEDWNSDIPPRPGGPLAVTPWVRRLLLANAVVFLLTQTVFTGRWVAEVFGFTPAAALSQPWTILTYAFIHGGFFHLAGNMLILFFFGPSVEMRLGGNSFVRFYLFCATGGAAFALLLQTVWPSGTIVGASGAVLGVALAFAMFWPNARVFVFPFPVPIKVKWLVGAVAAMAVFFQLAGARQGIAHLAHLGGFLFAFLYLRGLPYLAQRTVDASERKQEATRVLVHPSAQSEKMARHRSTHSAARPGGVYGDGTDALDRVLDKISATGLDSLTDDEHRILNDASRRLRDR